MTINVEVVQASECITTGKRIITLLCEYPRAIHSQLLTHRVFSKNSSSSRAVPIKKAIQNVFDNPAKFIWTENQAGMQGDPIGDPEKLSKIQMLMHDYMHHTLGVVAQLGYKETEGGLNVHKQNAARFLEPFQNIKILLTSTEWDNWDWLRVDVDAQPEITELANKIKEARDSANYVSIHGDEWHMPFVIRKRDSEGKLRYYSPENEHELSFNDAINLSLSCNAQTSYRLLDYTQEKTDRIIGNLFNGRKVHASPSEHIASPIGDIDTSGVGSFKEILELMPEGITHVDKQGNFWSGNLQGFLQYRQLLPNHDGAKLNV